MTPPLIAGCLWILAATVVAFLPMRRQYVPGVALLLAAPVLIGWTAWVHGWLWGAFGAFAFVSMFRNPLIYFWKRVTGRPVELPPELRK